MRRKVNQQGKKRQVQVKISQRQRNKYELTERSRELINSIDKSVAEEVAVAESAGTQP